MAKRVLLIDGETGLVTDTLSARHEGDARAERAHIERWIQAVLDLRKREQPDRRFIACEVQTRHGEDEAVLHFDMYGRRKATVHWRPDGTPEVTDIGMPPDGSRAFSHSALAAPPKLRAWR